MKALCFVLLLVTQSFGFHNIYNASYSKVFIVPGDKQTNFDASLAMEKGTVYVGSPTYKNDGGVFKCKDEEDRCELFFYSATSNNESVNCRKSSKYRINQTLLGATIELNNDKLLICDPGWYLCTDNVYAVTGICIEVSTISNKITQKYDQTTDENQTLTMIDKENKKRSSYKYGFAQYGFSTHLDETGEYVFGAPGVHFSGTVFIGKKDLYDNFDYSNKSTRPFNKDFYDIYFGYAVNSGKFNKQDIWYVAGAPRYNETMKHGLVVVFTKEGHIIQNLTGSDTISGGNNSYFGSSLAVAKFNNGDSALFVGAPTYLEEKTEKGAVYIYHYRNQKFQLQDILKGKKNSRFGTTISNLGKVNYDDYDDIAISAPCEDNQQGAIYVYFGSKEGKRWKNPQKISAQPEMRIFGFGFSLSKGADYDGNGLNDFAVGSYNSSNVYVYLSRHMVTLNHTITTSLGSIANETTFTVTFCVKYNFEVNKLETLDLQLNYFVGYENRIKSPNNIEQIMTIRNGAGCRNILVELIDYIENRDKPLELIVSYKTSACEENREACPKPAQNKNSAKISINFIHECGADLKCQFESELNSSFDNKEPVIYDVAKNLILTYEIKNLGPEIMPEYSITASSKQINKLFHKVKDCKEGNAVTCSFSKKIRPGQVHEGELKFSLENLKYDESIIEMSVVMNSAEVRKEENVKISVLKDHKVDISPVHPNTTMNIDQTNNIVIRNFSINNSGRTKMRDAKVFVKYFDPKPKMIVVKIGDLGEQSTTEEEISLKLNDLGLTNLIVKEIHDLDLIDEFIKDNVVVSKMTVTVRNKFDTTTHEDKLHIKLIGRGVKAAIISSILGTLFILIILILLLWKCDFFKRDNPDAHTQTTKPEIEDTMSDNEGEGHSLNTKETGENNSNTSNYDNSADKT